MTRNDKVGLGLFINVLFPLNASVHGPCHAGSTLCTNTMRQNLVFICDNLSPVLLLFNMYYE